MNSGRLLSFLLVVAGTLVVCRGIDVPFCPRELCSCPEPNGQMGDAVHVKDGTETGCLCSCGRELTTECTTDDHCAKGTICGYGKDLSKSGLELRCQDKCSQVTCPQYQQCQLIDNEAQCNCHMFDCSPDISQPIDATRLNTKKSFISPCDLVNTNCELLITNQTPWVAGG